jgi:molecular chaperone DnaJ
MNKKDHYSTLGINENASSEEIKSAYRALTKKHHPDRSSDPEDESKYKDITEAYDVLSDQEKRNKYDVQRKHGGNGMFYDMEDMFSSLFNNFSSSKRNYQKRAKNLDLMLSLDLSEIYGDTDKELEINYLSECDLCAATGAKTSKQCSLCGGSGKVVHTSSHGGMTWQNASMCNPCGGRGKIIEEKCEKCDGRSLCEKKTNINIKIPRAVRHGHAIKLPNLGHEILGGPRGDVLIHININEHKVFKYNGGNLIASVTLSMKDIINNNKIKFIMPNGENVEVEPKKVIEQDIASGYVAMNKGVGKGNHLYVFANRINNDLSDDECDKIGSILQ